MLEDLAFDPSDVDGVFAVRVRFLGATESHPPRYSATWEGWTDSGPVRRTIPAGTLDRRVVAARAATVFRDWLNRDKESPTRPHRLALDSVSLGELPGGEFIVTVKTKTESV